MEPDTLKESWSEYVVTVVVVVAVAVASDSVLKKKMLKRMSYEQDGNYNNKYIQMHIIRASKS